MSTCPTNPQYQPLSRDTTNSCGINNDIKLQTNVETYAYIVKNPQITRSCDGDGGDGGDGGGGDGYVSDDSDDSDAGNDPKVEVINVNNIAPSNPLFPDITDDIINDAMNLVAKNDILVGAVAGNLSHTIDNGGGSVCHYKPIKF